MRDRRKSKWVNLILKIILMHQVKYM
jgi:hypothetical protein